MRSATLSVPATILALCLGAGLLSGAEVVPAGGKEGGRDPFTRMTEKLGITDKVKLEAMGKAHEAFLADRMRLSLDMDQKNLDLKRLMLASSLDLGAVKKNCDERSRIWAEMQMLVFQFDANVKKHLTPDQWKSYIAFRLSRMGMMDGGPRGGRGEGPRDGEGPGGPR